MKVVLILSGGMDSTTLLYDLFYKGHDVHALSFDYGQRHRKELECAGYITHINKIPWKVVDIDSIGCLINNSALTGAKPVPHGHYADDNMKATVVPNRNMIMLSIAIGYAINIGAETVAYAAHAGDHTIYPDCRPEFVAALGDLAAICHFTPIKIHTPYLHWSKNDICKKGLELDVPYEDTWTCYEGGDDPCGKCGACVERAEAFASQGAEDPLCLTM